MLFINCVNQKKSYTGETEFQGANSKTWSSVVFVNDVRRDGIDGVNHRFDTVHSNRAHAVGHGQQRTASAYLKAKKDCYQCSHIHPWFYLIY
jgi:hypothetical protein